MENLLDKIKSHIAGAIGNRINLVGNVIIIGGICSFILNSGENQSYNFKAPYILSSGLGLSLKISSCFGQGTRKIYQKTKEHIKKYRRLDPRFLRKIMVYEDGDFIGYCEQQGAYLAARDTGQLKHFNEFKRQYSKNILPNF